MCTGMQNKKSRSRSAEFIAERALSQIVKTDWVRVHSLVFLTIGVLHKIVTTLILRLLYLILYLILFTMPPYTGDVVGCARE